MNGKGSKRRWGNETKIRDHYDSIFPPRKTSQEWCDIHQVFVIDADGWRDDPQSWGRRITEAEFNARLVQSTIMHRTPNKSAENS